MNNDLRIRTALFNTRRYSNYAMASEVAMGQKYWTPVLLGDDGRFWVPGTNREARLLIKAGYEAAA